MAIPQMAPMGRPLADVAVFGIQKRDITKHTRPWIVRWRLNGRQRSRAFRTKTEAERYRTGLLLAQQHGEVFDDDSGEPVSWAPAPEHIRAHAWARQWLAEQWPTWAPRSRHSAVEAIARLVPLVVAEGAPAAPEGMRRHLVQSLRPDGTVDDLACERWLEQHCLQLRDLDKATLAVVEQRLGIGDRGVPLGPATAGRFRKLSKACIRRAVELEVIAVDPWPPRPRGRSQRKAERTKRSVDVRALPSPATMIRTIDALVSHQPSSRMYRTMTACMYYAGLRPSEVVMLRASSLDLPPRGWGRIDVTEADISFDEPGEPKTGPRSVPIPPVLRKMLREWVREHSLSHEDLIFRTRKDTRPTGSNWSRALQRALAAVGARPMRLYDCRHAAATTWLRAGVPLGEVARRMGHSVETLVSTYVGALEGDEALANKRIEAELAKAVA